MRLKSLSLALFGTPAQMLIGFVILFKMPRIVVQMNACARFLALFGSKSLPLNFEDVYRQEVPRVYNFFRFRTDDDALAEDLTSATLEKAWRSREEYRQDVAALILPVRTGCALPIGCAGKKMRLSIPCSAMGSTRKKC